MTQTTLSRLAGEIRMPAQTSDISVCMDTVGGFESLQRIANLFSKSQMVPARYQGNLPDCFIAVDMALRMGANPLMVMQNLYVVHGSPAWSAQFLIATFNKSGRFSAIRYEFQGREGTDEWGCRAVASELATREKLEGPLVTIDMAKKEGWYGKNGSKWQTMPEQMLRYRAAAWLVRAYAPEIAMGLHTVEEIRDNTIDITPASVEPEQAAKEPAKPAGKGKSHIRAAQEKPAAQAARGEVVEMTPEAAPADEARAEDEISIRYECPIEIEGGRHNTVTREDCLDCDRMQGCPAYEEFGKIRNATN